MLLASFSMTPATDVSGAPPDQSYTGGDRMLSQHAGNGVRGRLAGDRPPSFAPPPATRPDCGHAGKSTLYSGETESLDRDPGIATLDPGMRFPGN